MLDTDKSSCLDPVTLSPYGATQTEETEETEFPTSNAEFLRAVFSGLQEPLRPFVLGFEGNPHDRAGNRWGGKPYRAGAVEADGVGKNWYFSLATFTPDDTGYHRRGENCAQIYGVMLDDIGTKSLPLARLDGLPPSYIVETSAGNYQAGYLFDVPQTDIKLVSALVDSLVLANLCDPGAKSPATRWGRLPFAVNGKTTPAFQCRLVEFHPDRRYSADEIMAGLELAPPAKAQAKERASTGQSKKAASIDRNSDDEVYTPKGENEVIAALKLRGLYKQPLGGGKHDITCPWVHEHTGGVDNGSAYWVPDDSHPVGGYRCLHGHCDGRRIGALIDFLGLTYRAARHKPVIQVAPGNLHRIVEVAEMEISATGRYYQRGGLIVSIQTDPETNTTAIKPTTVNALTRACASVAIWERYDGRSGAYVVTDPPVRHINVLADSEGYRHLPILSGIVRQPHLRGDGTVCTASGYDPHTGLFGVFDARQFDIPTKPTRAQAQAALEELLWLLSEFEFRAENDKAAAVSGMLTATIRQSLPAAPLFHAKAATIASGKSYLCKTIAAFAGPRIPSASSFPTTEEECSKLMLSTLLESPGVVWFDNLTTDLIPFKSMCSALTEPTLQGRILGVSKIVSVGTRALFISSGNNVDPIRDMARRTVTITLDPKTETPAARQYSGDPIKAILSNRGQYVSLALTVILGWIAAGRPVTKVPALGSFDAWSDLCRQPLLWLGMEDPAAQVFESMAQDPDRETLGRLLQAWRGVFGRESAMVRDAVQAADKNQELKQAMEEIASERDGTINRNRVGKWIQRHQNRIVDGLRFERDAVKDSAARWMAKPMPTGENSVSSVSSVSDSPVRETVNGKTNTPEECW